MNFSFGKIIEGPSENTKSKAVLQKKDFGKIFSEINFDQKENINFKQDEPNILLTNTLSKFKALVSNNSNNIESLINQKRFSNEIQVKEQIDETNKNFKIFYGDRFFIYPHIKNNLKYYRSQYIKLTNRINQEAVLNFSPSSAPIKTYKKLEMTQIESFEILNLEMMRLEQMINTYAESNRQLNEEIKDYEDQMENLLKVTKERELHRENLLIDLQYGESHRKKLHEYIHGIKGNIRVYCRVKPTNNIDNSIISYPEMCLNVNTNEIYSVEVKNVKTNELQIFNFDKIFTEASNQEGIFYEVKPFIQSALDGESICIFAYGSTGSGKTFTMQGTYNSKEGTSILTEGSGILPRCADFIFEETLRLSLIGQKFKIYFSALEIYNENIYDLLDKNNRKNPNPRQPLSISMIKDDIQIKNLIWVSINSKSDILKYTKEASETRRSDSTQFNSTSSRSHAVFQIKLEIFKEETGPIVSIINIIDLAGSERSSLPSLGGKTKEEVDMLKKIQNEANFINKSLTTLGRIISMIGDKKSGKVAIPYRESKLTMVLQNSLKPNSKTVMIVTVCNEIQNYGLTKESLKFATNAMMSC